MASSDAFHAGDDAGPAQWPEPPAWMSYSSLKEAELCPRRWALRRASYPGIWDRPGYPDMPSLPSLLGDVTHNALEKILAEVVRCGCSSPNSACAVGALKAMGGYTRVISELVALSLQGLDTNPRAKDRVPALRAAMQVRVPEMRNRLQAVLSRSEFQPSPRTDVNAGVASGARGDPPGKRGARLPLGPGSYAEVTLRAESIRWLGRVDLLTIAADDTAIVDYKTGLPDDSHVEQLRLYALLWYRDKDRNPSATRASRLTIAYPNTDVAVEAPTQAQLEALEGELQSRVGVARRGLQARPPEARPSTALCANCPVRQLCEEYWEFLDGDRSPVPDEAALAWGDVEVRVDARNGPRSWWVHVMRGADLGGSGRIVLRTATESPPFTVGSQVRVLNGGIARDEDGGVPIVTLTSNSEMFVVDRHDGL